MKDKMYRWKAIWQYLFLKRKKKTAFARRWRLMRIQMFHFNFKFICFLRNIWCYWNPEGRERISQLRAWTEILKNATSKSSLTKCKAKDVIVRPQTYNQISLAIIYPTCLTVLTILIILHSSHAIFHLRNMNKMFFRSNGYVEMYKIYFHFDILTNQRDNFIDRSFDWFQIYFISGV